MPTLKLSGAPGRTRTLDPVIRSHMLYPAELLALINGRGERIRTSDPLCPRQVRYQTALRPDKNESSIMRWLYLQPKRLHSAFFYLACELLLETKPLIHTPPSISGQRLKPDIHAFLSTTDLGVVAQRTAKSGNPCGQR